MEPSADRKERARLRAQLWREANRERHRAYTREYRKKNAAECYRKNRVWAAENPELVKQYQERSKAKHPDTNGIAAARWRKNNAEHKRCLTRQRRARVRDAQGSITRKEWEQILAKYGPACLCCKEIKPLTMDHICPISLRGEHAVDNVQPLCLECNSRKGVKIIDYRPGV